MSEPRFPPPRASAPYRSDEKHAPAGDVTNTPAPVVVTRPDPPPESAPRAPAGERPKFTPDEMRALLAVTKAQRPWGRAAVRGGVIVVPTGAISLVLNVVAGKYSTLMIGLLLVSAIVWTARPFWAKDRHDWG